MGKIAFVFAGQGAQRTGMGRELFLNSPSARRLFELADSIRPGTSAQCFSGETEDLERTINTQPCLFCADMAAALALREGGVIPDMLAGFSLGEIAALCFSQALSPADAFSLVCRRAQLMHSAAQGGDGGMAAVLKLPNADVEALCKGYAHVYPVNYNCPGQLVVAGRKDELELFKAEVKAAGGKVVPLAVSGGFHSPFMDRAATELEGILESIPFALPKIPVYSNLTARPYGKDMAGLLAGQVKSPVRWQRTIENMIADGADTFIEAGPGRTLCALISKINGDVRTLNVEDIDSLKNTLSEVRGIA